MAQDIGGLSARISLAALATDKIRKEGDGPAQGKASPALKPPEPIILPPSGSSPGISILPAAGRDQRPDLNPQEAAALAGGISRRFDSSGLGLTQATEARVTRLFETSPLH